MVRWLGIVAFLLLSLVPNSSAGSAKPIDKAHRASHQIHQEVLFDGATCNATAIGPQALLTATHCELPTDKLYVRGIDPVQIVGRIRDDQDHTIYLIRGAHFADYVDVNLKDPQEQGENVFMFGNPGQWQDQYRRGYITGTQEDHSLAAFFGAGVPPEILFDFPDYHGDSGAAIYNESGQVIDVVSTHEIQSQEDNPNDSIRLTGAFVLGFSQAALDQARNFSIPDDPTKYRLNGKLHKCDRVQYCGRER